MTFPLVPESFVPVAITDRSGVDESVHFGAVVALGPDGEIAHAWGDPDVVIYPRSALKPLQADTMVGLGLDLPDDQLALGCASHDGTARHQAVVTALLGRVGCEVSALHNTPSLPIDKDAAEATLASGGGPTSLAMNCSGKHAAMIATCVICGWDPDDYLNPDHPLQQAIIAHVGELAGGVNAVGVDGCGAPTHAISLSGLARAYRHLAVAKARVWQAMIRWPELVGGDQRDNTRLMQAVPGLMVKDGAEGVMAAALPDGRAVAVKISDGQARAAGVVMAAALGSIGVSVEITVGPPVLGHGRPVGRIRALW